MEYDVVIVDTGYNLSHPKIKGKKTMIPIIFSRRRLPGYGRPWRMSQSNGRRWCICFW